MKKQFLLFALAISVSALTYAQTTTSTNITPRNSWLKLGLNAGVPVGDIADFSSFALGLELKGQLMETNHVGIGLTTGYTQFFGKDGFDDFGSIPLGAFIRAYPRSEGFFAGLDVGYNVITGDNDLDGGLYLRPQIGYHNYNWNVFGYYNHVFVDQPGINNVAQVGIGATYNIRFK